MRVWNWQGDSSVLKVPEWAPFLEAADYRAFIAAVGVDLHRRGDKVEINHGVARLVLEDGSEHRFGLQNLAQICSQAEAGDWPEVIKGHFDGVIRSSASADLESLAEDWDRARAMIKVRLYPHDAVADTLPGLAYREAAEGLLAVLTYDLPDAVATVPRTDVRKWPLSFDEAFELGLDNVMAQDPVHDQEVELESGGCFTAMIGDSFFVTSRMLTLDRTLDGGEFGALVAVPNRHTMLVSPIVDLTAMEVLNAMLVVAHHRHEEGPGPLSPHLFWCRDGVSPMTLRATVDGDDLSFTAPEEFVDTCLQHLPRPRGGYGPN
ncbi:MAG: hypothetical protein JKY37_11290 [Nannocystaceae bacterium]|nr:hypothetical protein [Nannocystaceae bacterium]